MRRARRHHRLHDPAASGASPPVINGSRRKRIAKGSGTAVEDVNRLLKQFVQARKIMKQIVGGGGKAMKRWRAACPSFANERTDDAVDSIEKDGNDEEAVLPRRGRGLARVARRALRRDARATTIRARTRRW